ncbi:MAG: SLC13 family permease [Gemmatimonadota bacterium]
MGLALGALAFAAILLTPPPGGLAVEAWRTAAVAVLMGVWWMTEAIPIPATALLPLVLFPLLGVLPMTEAAEPYANDLIFLFMGGFFLAVAMEGWNLHKRIALGIVAAVGTSPEGLVLGFMIATAFLSMWISNTATAAMMLPIGLAVAAIFRPEAGDAARSPSGGPSDGDAGREVDEETSLYPFGTALMLGIAYGASIGGVATLIGTPPNAVLAGAASEMLQVEIGFLQWMLVGLPLTVVMLPVAWLLLVRVLYPPGEVSGDAEAVLEAERASLGPVGRGEATVAIVFTVTALAWVMRAPKTFGGFTIPGIQTFAPEVRDSTIAMAAAVALFLIPVDWKRGRFALGWERARTIPWGVLILFGGGLSLARAMDVSGLAAWIGGAVTGLGGVPVWVLVLVTAALFVFLTEMTSNTATSTMAMPVMVGAAAGLGMAPVSLMAAAALSASMAFMLPVATPPNAIVFASPHVTIPRMMRAGFFLNLAAIAIITVAVTVLVPRLLPSGL